MGSPPKGRIFSPGEEVIDQRVFPVSPTSLSMQELAPYVSRSYNALLLSALQRIPHDVRSSVDCVTRCYLTPSATFPQTGMAITYYPVFRSAKGTPITVCNLHFERLCVVYNLAALYSHLAKAEYDSDGDLKVVGRYCQASNWLYSESSPEII